MRARSQPIALAAGSPGRLGLQEGTLYAEAGQVLEVATGSFRARARILSPRAEFVFESPLGLSPAHRVALPILNHGASLSVYHHNRQPLLVAGDFSFPLRSFALAFGRVWRPTIADGPFGKGWAYAFGEHFRIGSEPGLLIHSDDSGRESEIRDLALPEDCFFRIGREAGGEVLTLTQGDGTRKRFFRGPGTDRYFLSAVEDACGQKLLLSYNQKLQLERVRHPLGQELVFVHDDSGRSLGRVRKILAPYGHRVEFDYNDAGLLASAAFWREDKRLSFTGYGYEASGRLESVSNLAIARRLVGLAWGLEGVDSLTRGPEGGAQLTACWSGEGFRDEQGVLHAYSFEGELPRSHALSGSGSALVTSYTYDQKRLASLTHPDGRSGEWSYREALSESDRRGAELVLTDTRKPSSGEGSLVDVTAYFGAEKHFALMSETDARGYRVDYEADSRGRILSRSAPGPAGEIVNHYAWNEFGQLEKELLPDGRLVFHLYYDEEQAVVVGRNPDLEGQEYAVVRSIAAGQSLAKELADFTRDELIYEQRLPNLYGRIESEVSPEGATQGYQSEAYGPLTRITSPELVPGQPLSAAETEHELDDYGRVRRTINRVPVPTGAGTVEAPVYERKTNETLTEHDDLGRITRRVETSHGEPQETRYHYKGALLGHIAHPDCSYTEYAYDDLARVVAVGENLSSPGVLNGAEAVDGDAYGLVEGSSITYSQYDDLGRLRRVYEQYKGDLKRLVREYGYDPHGRRSSERDCVNGVTRSFELDEVTGTSVTTIRSEDGAVLAQSRETTAPHGLSGNSENLLEPGAIRSWQSDPL
ncbi:MAG: hypothetical protein HQL31_04835, partial [Planctomycetes bacterium]|nr:hypothetical protein [Planctomycetota bacterium]